MMSIPELQFASQCVLQTSRMVAAAGNFSGGSADIWKARKDDGGIVTDLDFAVQAQAADLLDRTYPNDAFVAEENSGFLLAHPDALPSIVRRLSGFVDHATPDSVVDWVKRGEGMPTDRFWMMDPIDSTSGFVKGDVFSIQLSGLWDGAVQVCAMAYPRGLGRMTSWVSGLLFLAARGHGAWCAPLDDPTSLTPLRVSRRPRAEAIRLRSQAAVHADQSADDLANRDLLTQILATGGTIRSRATVRYPLLAVGEGDLSIRLVLSGEANQHLLGWDHAAGTLLVEEAGGRVTDLRGRALDFFAGATMPRNHGLVASNGRIHDEILVTLRTAGIAGE